MTVMSTIADGGKRKDLKHSLSSANDFFLQLHDFEQAYEASGHR